MAFKKVASNVGRGIGVLAGKFKEYNSVENQIKRREALIKQRESQLRLEQIDAKIRKARSQGRPKGRQGKGYDPMDEFMRI